MLLRNSFWGDCCNHGGRRSAVASMAVFSVGPHTVPHFPAPDTLTHSLTWASNSLPQIDNTQRKLVYFVHSQVSNPTYALVESDAANDLF